MRLVRVKAPQGKGRDVARLAFDAGISQASIHQQQTLKPDGEEETKDIVDVETSTPAAKAFLDSLMSADFFDPQQYSITVRQPRTIVSREGPQNLTRPLAEPSVDIFEELWQFSHVTYGFAGRILIGGMFLAYGMIESKLLIMIAGLLFLPLLPLLLAMGFGIWTRQWRLASQGLIALVAAVALLAGAGVLVASLTNPPLQYNEHNSLIVSFLISLGVGVAAGLATGDDVGRREMIGLAATAQLAIVPVWFGIIAVFGAPPLESSSPRQRVLTFAVNVGTVIASSLATYAVMGASGEGLRKFGRIAKK
jgi:hypothetical protein